MKSAGANRWFTDTVPSGLLPSKIVYGALLARLLIACQVVATWYLPGVTGIVHVATLVPVPPATNIKSF